jgi:hypothetical protein
VARQFLAIADAGEHQDLWRIDGAERQDHFAVRPYLAQSACVGELDADHPGAL